MLATQNEYEQALNRVAQNQAVEGRMRAGWAQQGMATDLIDTIMATMRSGHAEELAAIRAYERRSAQVR